MKVKFVVSKFQEELRTFCVYYLCMINFVFRNASLLKIRQIKDILINITPSQANQLILIIKSTSYFSKGTCELRSEKLSTILGVRSMSESERCVENSILYKRYKNHCFVTLIFKKKIQSWQPNDLSQARRMTNLSFKKNYLN